MLFEVHYHDRTQAGLLSRPFHFKSEKEFFFCSTDEIVLSKNNISAIAITSCMVSKYRPTHPAKARGRGTL